MRRYPRNSPQAATRILALAMLVDGHQCKTEMDLLDRLDVHDQLGLPRHELHAIVHTFCEDLLAFSVGMCWSNVCRMDPGPLRQVLDEVDDPQLQLKVLGLCILLVEADRHQSESESSMLAATLKQWGLHRSTQRHAMSQN